MAGGGSGCAGIASHRRIWIGQCSRSCESLSRRQPREFVLIQETVSVEEKIYVFYKLLSFVV